MSRHNSPVQETDSVLFDESGACSSKPISLYSSEVAAVVVAFSFLALPETIYSAILVR